jgi:protein required for attachment to host cells
MMMPITRRDIEVLLDTPDRTDFVVSAYADLRVKDGFNNHVETELKNQARALNGALAASDVRKALDAHVSAIRRAVETANGGARGLAVFAGLERGLLRKVPLDFPVMNRLVIDEEPFLLPLLERWHAQPNYLVAVVDSHHVHLFEAFAGVAEEVGGVDRPIDPNAQRDKPRFTYKKRFSQTQHERLTGLDADTFLKTVAETIKQHWGQNGGGAFTGLILLGQPPVTSAVRRLMPKELDQAVVLESSQAMTNRAEDVADDVARALEGWRAGRRAELLTTLDERRKEKHLIADGPIDVLDALQQGRATKIVVGSNRKIAGARCSACGYRFGTQVGTCAYCQAPCKTVNAVQEILRMAVRHRVPVFLLQDQAENDPLAATGGVSALLRAEANWAPDAATARASMGH